MKKVQEYLKQYHMVSPGDEVLIGLSGGADSVCLFRIFQKLQQTMGFSMEVIHVEHGIRGEDSVNDAEFVENLCEEYGVPFHLFSVDVPAYAKEHHMGHEEAARVLRYQKFCEYAKSEAKAGKQVKIALAHHMDDNAETILFQMIRGSGLTGVCGMRPVRKDQDGVCYIRPLLCVERGEIEQYLQAHGQAYCTDATNADIEYSRNRIRNCILPELCKLNDQAILHMNQTARRLMDVKEFLDQETDILSDEMIVRQGNQVSFSIEKLETLQPAIAQELVRRAIFLAAGKQKDITSTHVQGVMGLTDLQSGRQVHLPYGIQARREYDRVILDKLENTGDQWEQHVEAETLEALQKDCMTNPHGMSRMETIILDDNRGTISFRVRQFLDNKEEIPKKPYTKWLDYDMIKSGFLLRNRHSGDFFYTDSMGHRKKLKEYFINEKIPSEQRQQMILLANQSEIFWIVGGRISDTCKITGETNYILEINYNGGK